MIVIDRKLIGMETRLFFAETVYNDWLMIQCIGWCRRLITIVQSCSPTHLLIEVFSSLTICTGYRICVPLDKTILFGLVGKPPVPLTRARDERLPGWWDHASVMVVMFGGDESLRRRCWWWSRPEPRKIFSDICKGSCAAFHVSARTCY